MAHHEAVDYRHTIKSIDNIWNYIKGGHGRFTIKSEVSGVHHTYKVTMPKEPDTTKPIPLWISVLTGPDQFVFLGTIWEHTMSFSRSLKTNVPETSELIKAIHWIMRRVAKHEEFPDTMSFWHEGYCGRCGRVMTNPESIETGFGPTCSGRN